MRSEVPGEASFKPGDAEPVGQDADHHIVCSNLFFAPLDCPQRRKKLTQRIPPSSGQASVEEDLPPHRRGCDEVAAV